MAKDFWFTERAVKAFTQAADNGELSPRHVRDVIRYKTLNIDETLFEPYLKSSNDWVRRCTAQVLGEIGSNLKPLIEAAKIEQNKSTLIEILKQLMKSREGLEELVYLLESKDTAIKEQAIGMFRRAGRSDCLMTLLFDDDDSMVSRIKRYMDEANK